MLPEGCWSLKLNQEKLVGWCHSLKVPVAVIGYRQKLVINIGDTTEGRLALKQLAQGLKSIMGTKGLRTTVRTIKIKIIFTVAAFVVNFQKNYLTLGLGEHWPVLQNQFQSQGWVMPNTLKLYISC